MTSTHLHLVREKEPDINDRLIEVYCPECDDHVYVIHLNRPPVDPE